MRGGAQPRGKPPSSSRKDGFKVEHTKDCIVNAEHYALRDITRPYKSLAWTTALAIVREKVRGSEVTKNAIEFDDYFRGRYDMARDILAEMEERGKP